MPTQHPRIPVTKDAALADALATVARYYGGKKLATIVHDLAVKGAEAVVRERQAKDEAIERLIAVSTQRSELLSWEVLENIDDLAWRE